MYGAGDGGPGLALVPRPMAWGSRVGLGLCQGGLFTPPDPHLPLHGAHLLVEGWIAGLPARLVTRTKESNVHASRTVERPPGKVHAKRAKVSSHMGSPATLSQAGPRACRGV